MDETTGPSGSMDGNPIVVHKANAEGALAIGSLSGRILTPIMERPEWSEGLAVAKLGDRVEWYQQRLGKDVSADTVVAFEDLGWVCVDAEGGEMEITADSEFRMDIIAEATGVIRSNDLSSIEEDSTIGELAHVITDESHDYSHGQPRAIEWTEALAEAAADSERKVQNG